jgi:uncharacterized membrane protein YgaE (UPF0421/DUF939 family)
VAAATAWWVASALLGHQRPFFAPVAAVVALGVSYAARLRRVGEVVAGVALGVAVGDVFVLLAGTGTWQIALVIAVAMSLAVLLNAGPMLITQAGVQAAIVTTLVPATAAGLDRWLDAVVGGAVALVAAAVVPTSPLRRPRRLAAGLLDDLADVLMAAANSARHRDPARAGKALQRARQTQTSLDELSDAAQEGLDVLQVSPFRRRHRRGVQDIWSIAEPLDRGYARCCARWCPPPRRPSRCPRRCSTWWSSCPRRALCWPPTWPPNDPSTTPWTRSMPWRTAPRPCRDHHFQAT